MRRADTSGELRAALDRLGGALERVRREVDARRAFSCSGCPAPCCRVGHNGMLVTPLEAEAIGERLREDPALAAERTGVARRTAAVVARHRLRATPEPGQTWTCPLLGEGNRCLVHGRGQPLGCITFTTKVAGARAPAPPAPHPLGIARAHCDQDVGRFERGLDAVARLNDAVYGRRGWTPSPLPVALARVLRVRVTID